MSSRTNGRQTALEIFNAMSSDEAAAVLKSCLSVPTWVAAVDADRPYSSWQRLEEVCDSTAGLFDDADFAAALAGHPRIGEPPSAGHDVEQSRREQRGVATRDLGQARALAAGNAQYEDRFHRIFLVRAAGRSTQEILVELQRRLTNDEITERMETVHQLVEIALLRLETALYRRDA